MTANTSRKPQAHRLKRIREESGAGGGPAEPAANAIVDCGWGRLIFGNTFESSAEIAAVLRAEGPDRRDIAFYVPEPQVVLSHAPQEIFLDPSVTYRLDFIHLPRRAAAASGVLDPAAGHPQGRGGGEPALCRAGHGPGRAGVLLGEPRCAAPERAGRGGCRDRPDPRLGDGRRSRQGVQRPPAGQLALVPRYRVAARAPCGDRRVAGAPAGRAVPGARGGLHGSLGAPRQHAGDRALREARLPAGAGLRAQAQEPDQRDALYRPAGGRGAQPLCRDHRARGAPPRDRGGCDRRHRGAVPAQLRRTGGALPGGAVGVHLRGRALDLRRQGADQADRRPAPASRSRRRSTRPTARHGRVFSRSMAASWSSRPAASRARASPSASRPSTRSRSPSTAPARSAPRC